MSLRETYESKTEEILTPIAEANGVRVYDVEYVKEGSDYYLRAYIDKEDGVDILDCENVSRALSDALDAVDFIPDAYILEVSSPGLGRTLKKDRHFEQSIGEEVEIKLYKPQELPAGSGNKVKELSGILVDFDKDTLTIADPDKLPDSSEELETEVNPEQVPELPEEAVTVLQRSDVALVRLALDF